MATEDKAVVPVAPSLDSMVGDDAAVVPYAEEASVAVGSRTYSMSSDGFDNDEIMYPRLRLAQGLTAEVQEGNAKPGTWVLSGYEPMQQVRVIPIAWGRARELRDKDRNIVCSSANGILGEGDPGGSCADCPMSQWSEPTGNSKRNTPPACQNIYSYVCYSAAHEGLVAVEFRSTSIQTAKYFNTLIKGRGLGNVCIQLAAKSVQGQKGTFYTPTGVMQPMTEEEKEAARLFMSQL